MSFHEVQFPTDISYGSVSGAGYDTSVIEVDSGQEQRVARRSRPRHRYDVAYGIKSYEQLATVLSFYHARLGVANGFRFKDWVDFNSNPTNPGWRGSGVGTQDQLIGVGTGSQTQYQLVKKYTSGPTTTTRIIEKPVTGTVSVWVNGVLQTLGVNYTIDTTTGIITFAVAPANGLTIHASFEFDVPVRFGQEVDASLPVSADEFDAGSISSIPLVEILSPDAGNVGEYFYGGATERVISADLTISTGLGRFWTVSATVVGKSIILPNPATIPTGGPIFYLENTGANNIAVKDHLGVTLLTLTTNTGCEILLRVDSGGTKVWHAQ